MSFSIEFQVTKLQEEEVKHRTDVEKDKPVLAGKLNLMDDWSRWLEALPY